MYNGVISQYVEMMSKLLGGSRFSFAEASSRHVPQEPRVYTIYDKSWEAITYVGRTKNLRRRLLGDHKTGNIEGSQFRKALRARKSISSFDLTSL